MMYTDQTIRQRCLSNQLDDAASLLDLTLSKRRDPAGLDDDRKVRDTALAKDLAVAGREGVNHRHLGRVGLDAAANLSGDKGPELVEVKKGLVRRVAQEVEVAHTDLTEVTGVVTVKVGTVVVQTTSKTTTTGMLAVLADTTVTGRNVSTKLTVLVQVGRHL